MWHLMKKGKGLLFFLLCSGSGIAQTYSDPGDIGYPSSFPKTEITTQETAESSGWTVSPEVRFGYGSFQNIILPGGYDVKTGQEITVTKQTGLPFAIGLGVKYPLSVFETSTNLKFLKVSTLLGRTPGQQSSPGFSRLELNQDAKFYLSGPWYGNTGLGLRRDTFKDGSYAHVADILFAKIGSGVDITSWGMRSEFFYLKSLTSKFGFTNSARFAVDEVKGSKLDVQSFGLNLSKNFSKTFLGEFSFERSYVDVTYPTESAYKRIGLTGAGSTSKSRALKLSTDLATFGLVKHL